MTSSRTGSLEVLSLPDSSSKNRRNSSDGFRSPSPLPARQAATHSGNAPQELIKSIQTEGTKAAIHGNIDKVKEIVQDTKKHSCDELIDLTTEEDGYNMLHFAVCYKRLNIVKFLIENGANAECTTTNDKRDTPLMLAIRYHDSFTEKHLEAATTLQREENSVNIVTFLLKYANIKSQNASGATPLSLAVQKQNESITKILLDDPEVSVDKQNLQNYSPLHFACAGRNTNIIDMLLKRGADMFSKTNKGYIPFHIACQEGNVDAIEVLITMCPKEDAKKRGNKGRKKKSCPLEGKDKLFEAKDNLGNTAILLAKEAQTSKVFKVLQTKYNLDIRSKNDNGDGILHKFAEDDDGVLNAELLEKDECKRMLKESNVNKDTPLHIACQLGHWKSIHLFIEKGASISVSNAMGNTPLMTAIIAGNAVVLKHMFEAINRCKSMCYKDILLLNTKNNKTILTWAIENNHSALIQAIAQLDQHLVTEEDFSDGKGILHIAAASGALSIIQILDLPNSKHIPELLHQPDSKGRTPLMLAAQNGHLECVKVLHQLDEETKITDGDESNLDKRDDDDHTAIHLACLYGHLQVVDYLNTCGANLEASKGKDGTPLACAASKGNEKILNYLLNQNVNVNDGIKTTPLILASKNGHVNIVKKLLQHPDIDVAIQNEDGYNCLALAAMNRHLQVALAIINSSHWEKALKGCDKDSSTPLRLLIKYLPDAAEIVLFRCIKHIKNDKEEVTAIEMSFEFLDDFQDPIKGGLYGLVHSCCQRLSTQDDSFELEEANASQAREFPTSPVEFNNQNHVLQWMIQYERTRLLQHPVTRELVSSKWKAYAMPVFVINLAIYLVFLAFLTAYAIFIPLPTESSCRTEEDCSTDFSQVFLRIASTVLLGYCLVRGVLELIQLLKRRKSYLAELDNYLELLLLFSTFTFATAGQAEGCFCLEDYAWGFGALAVFLAWIDLVIYLKKLPFTAIPINMLQNIVVTFLKLIYLPVILIIAFAIPFYMLFSRPEFQNTFDTPGFSMMKSFMMTAGELDYATVFRFRDLPDDAEPGVNGTMAESPTSADLNYFTMSCILWVVFVILMPILFANLLIGLAVGDTQKVEEKATLTYLSLLVDLALEMEEKLPWIRRRLKKTKYMVEKCPKIPFYLFWYQKLTNMIFGNSFHELEQELITLESEDRISSLMQGLEVLEPIDDIKLQIQINSIAMRNIKDMLARESDEAAERDKRIDQLLNAIEDLKNNLVTRATPE